MENKKENSPRGINYLWLLAGAYLVYLGYDIIKSTLNGKDGGGIWSTLAAIVFIAAGIWLCLRELQAYRRSKQADNREEMENSDEEEA